MNMLGQRPGWYRDPAPRDPDNPDSARYWDGNNWTAQVRSASKQERNSWRAETAQANATYAREVMERAQAGDVEAQQILAAAAHQPGASRSVSGNGEPLSGWWRRAFGYWIDTFLMVVLSLLLSWRWIKQIANIYNTYLDQATAAQRAGLPLPDPQATIEAVAAPMLWLTVVFSVVTFAYVIGFLRAFSATPGQMAVGIAVRPVNHSGLLSWNNVLLRWLGQYGVTQLISLIPILGQVISSIYFLINHLWPLWDPRRQALHDKIAGTLVVRTRA